MVESELEQAQSHARVTSGKFPRSASHIGFHLPFPTTLHLAVTVGGGVIKTHPPTLRVRQIGLLGVQKRGTPGVFGRACYQGHNRNSVGLESRGIWHSGQDKFPYLVAE